MQPPIPRDSLTVNGTCRAAVRFLQYRARRRQGGQQCIGLGLGSGNAAACNAISNGRNAAAQG